VRVHAFHVMLAFIEHKKMFTYLHFQPPCSIYYHTLLVRAGPFYMYKIAKKNTSISTKFCKLIMTASKNIVKIHQLAS